MKCAKYLSIIIFLLFFYRASAQATDDTRALIKEGVQLNGEKKYAEAIDKYSRALKIDTGNLFACYQMALSLFNMDKGVQGARYLVKVANSGSALKAAADELLGLIWFREKKYADAEKYTIDAIKLDPKNAGTQRMYALLCFHQNKRANALLGFCSFLLLEPNNPRSAEAYGNIQHILTGGTLKAEPGLPAPVVDANTVALNAVISQSVAAAAKEKQASAADQLDAQLTTIFKAIGPLTGKQNPDDFFTKYYAGYFYQLAQSENMDAFVRLISQSTAESAQWIKDNPDKMADLGNWMKTTARNY
jgi:tetratricopeptide (TPR) repeat protein